MDDTLSQTRRQEEAAMQSSSVELSNRMAAQKHAELMEISNWATSLKGENERLRQELDECKRNVDHDDKSLIRGLARKVKRLIGS